MDTAENEAHVAKVEPRDSWKLFEPLNQATGEGSYPRLVEYGSQHLSCLPASLPAFLPILGIQPTSIYH